MVKSSFYSGSGNNPTDTSAITSLKNAAETAATNAAASESNTAAIAAASNQSAVDAASSEAAAQTSAQAAAASATSASASSVTASNASNSVNTAAVSIAADAATATQNAALASSSATNAASSEANSSASAASALASKNASTTSATNSATSAANSSQSASSALQSKNAAAASATSASASSASASTSSTASATSATNAAASAQLASTSATSSASSAANALTSKTSSAASALQASSAATEAASAIVKVGLTENVGGHKAVSYSGELITSSTLSSYAGITLQAGTSGTEVNVKRLGKLSDSSFSFTAGEPIYAGAGGAMVQNASPPLLRIGQAITSTVIELNPTITVEADDGLTPIPPSLIPGIQDNSTGVAITINSNNQVNIPNQPCLSTSGLSSVQGFGNYYRVIGNRRVNVGNHFSGTTGLFTAPCAGKYLVSLSAAASDGNPHIFRVVVNSTFLEMSFANSGDGNTVTRTIILPLSTGDTLEALSYQSSVGNITFTLALLS
jgi:hypothetical protein